MQSKFCTTQATRNRNVCIGVNVPSCSKEHNYNPSNMNHNFGIQPTRQCVLNLYTTFSLSVVIYMTIILKINYLFTCITLVYTYLYLSPSAHEAMQQTAEQTKKLQFPIQSAHESLCVDYAKNSNNDVDIHDGNNICMYPNNNNSNNTNTNFSSSYCEMVTSQIQQSQPSNYGPVHRQTNLYSSSSHRFDPCGINKLQSNNTQQNINPMHDHIANYHIQKQHKQRKIQLVHTKTGSAFEMNMNNCMTINNQNMNRNNMNFNYNHNINNIMMGTSPSSICDTNTENSVFTFDPNHNANHNANIYGRNNNFNNNCYGNSNTERFNQIKQGGITSYNNNNNNNEPFINNNNDAYLQMNNIDKNNSESMQMKSILHNPFEYKPVIYSLFQIH